MKLRKIKIESGENRVKHLFKSYRSCFVIKKTFIGLNKLLSSFVLDEIKTQHGYF